MTPRDLGKLSTDAAQAWRDGYAAGLAHARAQDPRWCIRDKATICASRDCNPERCVRVEGYAELLAKSQTILRNMMDMAAMVKLLPAETRARAPAAAPGCRAPAEAREAVSGEISGQCGGVK